MMLMMGVMTPANTVQPDSDATTSSKDDAQLERMNTAPTPVPQASESEKFHGSTIQKEEAKPKDDAQAVPTYEHNGYYRKGL
jgi:hypothetical protein